MSKKKIVQLHEKVLAENGIGVKTVLNLQSIRGSLFKKNSKDHEKYILVFSTILFSKNIDHKLSQTKLQNTEMKQILKA